MKKTTVILLWTIMMCMMADNVIVVQNKEGKAHAHTLADIDSIYIADGDTLPDSLFDFTEVSHDTIVKTVIIPVYNDTKTVVSSDGWHFNIENPIVSAYMNEVDYTGYEDDYSFSEIEDYANAKTDYVKYRPAGVTIQWTKQSANQQIILSLQKDFTTSEDTFYVSSTSNSCTIDNLYPNKKYYYRVITNGEIVKTGHFITVGQVRMMDLPSVCNVRDLGGWKTEDGHIVKYGRIYRGAELNRPETLTYVANHQISSADSAYMVDKLKIRLEIDLRDNRDMALLDTIKSNDKNFSALGDVIEYYNQQVHYYTNYMKYSMFRQRWKNCVSKLIKCLKEGKNCYFHCVWGADRTGTMSMLILGTLGVPQADLDKEYELTCLSVKRTRCNTENNYWKDNLAYIKSLAGATLRDKFARYLLNCGVTQQEIDDLRSIMLE